MRRKRAIFPIALACSLCLHAIGMDLYARFGWFLVQPLARQGEPRSHEMVVKVDPDLLELGEAEGKAIGINRSEGEHPLEAREADEDQALLSREPVGSGRRAIEAAGAAGPTGGGAPTVFSAPAVPVTPPKQLQFDAPPAPPPAVPKSELKEPSPQVRVSEVETEAKPQVVEASAPAPVPAPDQKPQPRKEQVAVAMPNPARSPQSGVPSSAGLPLPPSDSDSDPFSRVSSTTIFRNGRLEVQRGRKFKTVRPQIGIAGELDTLGMTTAVVVLEVHLDTTGAVSQVDVFKPSGSVAIDERTRDAVYHWSAEPARDKAGKPIPDVVYIAIEYR